MKDRPIWMTEERMERLRKSVEDRLREEEIMEPVETIHETVTRVTEEQK